MEDFAQSHGSIRKVAYQEARRRNAAEAE